MKLLSSAMLAMLTMIAAAGCSATHGPGAHRAGCGLFGGCGGGCPTAESCGDDCGSCEKCGHHLLSKLKGHCGHCGHCGPLCRKHGCGRACGRDCEPNAQIGGEPAGPPTGTVAYPYYTTRGPRDFYNPNPPSIGP